MFDLFFQKNSHSLSFKTAASKPKFISSLLQFARSIVKDMEVETATVPNKTIDEADEDDSETELERFQRFVNSTQNVKRIVAVRNVVGSCRVVGFNDASQYMFGLLDNIVADEDSTVKEVLAQQISPIIDFILKNGHPPEAAINTILSLAFKLLKDKDTQVRTATEDAFIEFGPKLNKELIEAPILTSVLYMAHEDENEDQRLTAMKLLGELAEVFGPELCMQFASPEAISLAGDPMFRVRKSAAFYIAKIAKVTPKTFSTEKLLPVFKKLTSDDIWGVRKACAESLPDMIEVFPDDTELIALVETFLNDTSRWVRTSMFTHLGRFIANLKAEHVTPRIVQLYGTMTSSELATPGENTILTHCAFNFPAVAIKIGPTRWNELQETYTSLAKDIQWNVRRTLALSVHVLAQHLGPQVTRDNLVPAVNIFLNDLDEVKVGILQHFAEFLAVLPEDDRESFLDVLNELEMYSENWRFRSILAVQMAALGRLYGEEILHDTFYPMLIRLMQDPVSVVRLQAAKQVCELLHRFKEINASWISDVIEEIVACATDTNYQHRIVFVAACESLLNDPTSRDIFQNNFLPPLIEMTTDKVPNVRIRVAAVLSQLPAEMSSADISEKIKTMTQDRDRDVKLAANGNYGATHEEMAAARIDLAYRDSCAKILIDLNKCRSREWFAPWKCTDERHSYERCQYEDFQRRVEKFRTEKQ